MFGDGIRDLVITDAQKIREHDLHDRAIAGNGQSQGASNESRLGDRRITNAIRTEFLEQSHRGLEGAFRFRDVLAHDEHARIFPHLVGDSRANRLSIGKLLSGHVSISG